ncbi:MAG: RNA-processing protein [Methanolinea sp.]|nr:RNA-processing protein [Methanolinea sp.]
MPSYWFGDVSGGKCTPAESRDPEYLSLRLDRILSTGEALPMPAWEVARDCGFVGSRAEYLHVLRALCVFRAGRALARVAAGPEQELLQMVRVRDRLDEAINDLSESALAWHAAVTPGFTRKYRALGGKEALGAISAGGSPRLKEVAAAIAQLGCARDGLTREISRLASEIVPNTAALTGGVVAARLLAAAGGLVALSRLPGSAIQVLGARTALFSHVRSGTPPPKHGIVYQCRAVHRAARYRRGKVARTLSAKLAIAARIDLFRGEVDRAFIEEARGAVRRAGGGREG